MKAGLIYDDVFLKHETPQFHPESKHRLDSIMKTIRSSDTWDRLVHIKPRRATIEEVQMVHSQDYVHRLKTSGSGYADPDTYISDGSLDAAFFAVGAVLKAVDHCRSGDVQRAFCAVRPPGHHAEPDRAMGFCIFNNVAVGARYAQKYGYEKVFIIDFDVHHGNGTQHSFYNDDTVFYFSTHQYPHYPGTGSESERGRGKGEGCTYNIPMMAGSGNKEYFYTYHDVLPHIVEKFGPDILLVSAGYDIHTDDPLASIRVSGEGVRTIVRSILSLGLPTVFALEGGYNLAALAESVLITLEEMLRG